MSAVSVTMLRSRGARPGRFQTSPSGRSCVYFSSAGETMRISSSASIGETASDLERGATVVEAADGASERETRPPGLAWEQAAASTESDMTVQASGFIPVLPRASLFSFCGHNPRMSLHRLAAVDDHGVADHEGGRVRAQPDDGRCDLLGLAHPSDRLLRDHLRASFGRTAGETTHHGGVDV